MRLQFGANELIELSSENVVVERRAIDYCGPATSWDKIRGSHALPQFYVVIKALRCKLGLHCWKQTVLHCVQGPDCKADVETPPT
ncbi:hypothetical protein J6590_038091 [Homalodisca vitripennis]|nr:hypothetical protein J6590_038091 [Homalodisca vitripennis]